MTTFITWPKSIDTGFRQSYFETTGEKIQQQPNDLGTHYRVGSSLITEAHIAALESEYPQADFT